MASQGGRASGPTHVPSQEDKEAELDISPTKNKTAGGGAGTSFAEQVAEKDRQTVLLAGEDSPLPKKRIGGEASEGEVQVVHKPANTKKKTNWPPKSTKVWSTGAKVAVMQLALRAEIWPKKRKGDDQQERIKAFERFSKEGVYKRIFEGKSTNNLRSMITNLMKLYRQHKNDVVVHGTGTSPEPLEGDMATLDKVTAQYVDAVAAAAQQMKKDAAASELDEAARHARIHNSRDQGMQNYRPGTGATPFSKLNFCPGGGGGTSPSSVEAASEAGLDTAGSSTGDGGARPKAGDWKSESQSDGGSDFSGGNFHLFNQIPVQESLKVRRVKGLGQDMRELIYTINGAQFDDDNLQDVTGASEEEMSMFLQHGWEDGQLSPDMATALMTAMVYAISKTAKDGEKRRLSETRKRKWSELHFRGVKLRCLFALCKHYGAKAKHLKVQTTASAYKLYTTGWTGNQLDQPVVDFINHTLAVMLLTGEDYEPPDSEEADDDMGDDDMTMTGKGKIKRTSKSGRETCDPKLRVKEDELTSQILAVGALARDEAKADRDAADARAMADRIAADVRFKAQADAEDRRFRAAADERDAERKHVKDMAEMRRQDDENRRKHELAMMELKVEAQRLEEAADLRFKAQADAEDRRFRAAADERDAERKHVKDMAEMRRQEDEDRRKHELAMMELKVEAQRLEEARAQRENKRS